MTLFYTETHLTSHPILVKDEYVTFDIAFAMITLTCRAHRPEVVHYLDENRVRKGDAVCLQAVFMGVDKPGEAQYISVNYIELLSVQTGKKRKFQQMQQMQPGIMSPEAMSVQSSSSGSDSSGMSILTPTGYTKKQKAEYTFIEITGCFREYLYMLYGQSTYVCDRHMDCMQDEHNRFKFYRESRELLVQRLADMMVHYDHISQAKDESEIKLGVVRFVHVVTALVSETHARFTKLNQTLPPCFAIDAMIPLPSIVFHLYCNSV
ncbi:hypothetical protein MAM1_0002d00250 [Mucor ambiguus]|uniref:Uncharacterized protein n=1 Tax=Mucor ambiguus TaxID=91626 RepID=A0A0C9LZQ9_9FUNG|nr:hypothetical protein MAM1_0002d00250 [Mucor ambiguus]